ncbi:MAG: hypothetical protein HQK54_12530 [Oligoflexales bacterium]|nr:hypothetical protein [Oligoflexales bacterium]
MVHLLECKWSETPAINMAAFDKAANSMGKERVIHNHIICSARGSRISKEKITIRDSVDFSFLHDS